MSDKKKSGYGININLVPGGYAPKNLTGATISDETLTGITKTVAELASKVALESYIQMTKEGLNLDKAGKMMELAERLVDPKQAVVNLYFPDDKPVEPETFFNLECPAPYRDDFPARNHRYIYPLPLEVKNHDDITGLINVYGSMYNEHLQDDLLEKCISSFEYVVDTLNKFKNKTKNVLNKYSEDPMTEVHVIPVFNPAISEFYYKCYVYVALLSDCMDFSKEVMNPLNTLIKNIEKNPNIQSTHLAAMDKNPKTEFFEFVIQFEVLSEFADYIDPEIFDYMFNDIIQNYIIELERKQAEQKQHDTGNEETTQS